jgi:hypothetical protein
MEQIEPSKERGWTGLAYYYHLCIGWEEEKNWQIPNLAEALLQFKKISLPMKGEYSHSIYECSEQVLAEIINMLSEAIERKLSVYILSE